MTALPARDSRLPWVAGGYLALTVLVTWPLALGMGRDVPGDLGDSLLNMWILAWGAEHAPRLITGATSWQAFWNANIFHPEPYTLALSEHLFAQVLQIAPVYALTGNLILCYNLLFLSTFVLSAVGAYLLVRDLTGDWRAGVIAGLVYGFLPYRISQVPHLQVLSSQWMPFALWGFHRYIAYGARRGLVGGTAALVLQNWSCGYYLLYFAPFVPLFALQQLWSAGRLRDRRAWGGLTAAAAVTAALTLPFLLPYLEVQRLYLLERPFGEVVTYSANVWSYATAAVPVHLWGQVLRLHTYAEGETFLGVTAVLLAAMAVGAAALDARRSMPTAGRLTGRRRALALVIGVALAAQGMAFLSTLLVGGFNVTIAGITVRASTPFRLLAQTMVLLLSLLLVSPRTRAFLRRWLARPETTFAALLLLAAWLSLGPAPSAGPSRVSGIGLYAVLYEYVPGFTGVRVPARYAMIVGLFLSIVAGYGASRLGRKRWGGPVLALAGVLIVADGAAMPLEMNITWGVDEATPPARIYPETAAPLVYQRVRELPDGTVLAEFPFGDAAWEIRYVYYAAIHRQRLVNGYSGAFPQAYRRRVALLQRLPTAGEAAWQALLDAGATHVVVHVPAFANPNDARALVVSLDAHGARLVEGFPEGDALYELPGR